LERYITKDAKVKLNRSKAHTQTQIQSAANNHNQSDIRLLKFFQFEFFSTTNSVDTFLTPTSYCSTFVSFYLVNFFFVVLLKFLLSLYFCLLVEVEEIPKLLKSAAKYADEEHQYTHTVMLVTTIIFQITNSIKNEKVR